MTRSCLFGVLLLLLLGCHSAKKTTTEVPAFSDTVTSITTPPAIPPAATGRTDSLLDQFFVQNPQLFDSIILNKLAWNVQVIYTQIDRNEKNEPALRDYFWNVDRNRYFYPASTVKMPVALMALQKLKELGVRGLDRKTTMVTGADYSGQTPVYNDPNTPDGKPNIGQYIKRIFLVSDNDAFNRLYEFVGPAAINENLRKMGYGEAQIRHRVDIALSEDENRHTNPIQFFDATGKLVYSQAAGVDNEVFERRNESLGKAFYKWGKLVNEPMDFSTKNRIALEDLHNILKSIYFPGAMQPAQRFNIYPDDYKLVYKAMSQYPTESRFPTYDTTEFYSAYCKFFMMGADPKAVPRPGLRIFNKVGDAYGFLLDVAYVVDFENKIEFMLSIVMYCNEDNILNDDHYDYERIGYPFFKNISEKIYQYELHRPRKYAPDLNSLRFDYQR